MSAGISISSGLLSITAIELLAQPRHPPRLGHPEHGAADDLECERSHALAEHELASGLPARDLSLGDLADDLAEGGHARALERRQQQLALAQVLGPVQDQHRVRSEGRLHERVRLAGPQVGLIAREQLTDRLRVGHVHALCRSSGSAR